MIDVRETEVANGRTFYGSAFPHALECESADVAFDGVLEWVRANANELETRAADCGVVLFRGFPIANDADFDAFVAAFGFDNFPYKESLSNAVRINRTERVFTANEAPPDVTIFLHHEMAQTPVYPS